MEQKNSLQGVLSLFLLVVAVLLVYSVFWGPLSDLGGYPSRTVSVTSSGKAVAKPDVALVSFSIVTEGQDSKAVIDNGNKKMNPVVSYLKEQGIDAKDIQTTEYNLQPVYTQPSRYDVSFVPSIAKYTLTQTVRVKIRDFSKISEIMGNLAPLGVNKFNNISFSVDDDEQFLSEARAEAFAKAREKAETMARQGGFRIGRVVSVNEYGTTPSVYNEYRKISSSVVGMGGDMQAPMPAAIEPGSSDLTVQVTIVYEIR